MDQTGGCSEGDAKERRRGRSEKTNRKGVVGRTNTCHVPESLNGSCPLLPHIPLRGTPFSVPPPPHLTHLCYRSWRGIKRPARGATAGRSWYGVVQGRAGQGQVIALPWEPEAGYSTLGEGCSGSPRRARKIAGSRAETERSLPLTLVRRADLGRPQPGWLRWGACTGFSFALQPGVLALALSFPPHPLYCRMTSAQPSED